MAKNHEIPWTMNNHVYSFWPCFGKWHHGFWPWWFMVDHGTVKPVWNNPPKGHFPICENSYLLLDSMQTEPVWWSFQTGLTAFHGLPWWISSGTECFVISKIAISAPVASTSPILPLLRLVGWFSLMPLSAAHQWYQHEMLFIHWLRF